MSSKVIIELKTCNILGVNINVTNMQDTINVITKNLEDIKGNYICVSNVHTTVMSYENEKYKNIQNSGFMALPDGKPLSIVSKKRGFKDAERVTGPDLMEEIFKISEEQGYSHYFYGSTQDTLDKLRVKLNNKYPNMKISGMYSPPFRKLTEKEDEKIVENINKNNPDFVWVGLGAPKQEIWMSEHKHKIDGLMLGVGAGFDYHAGNISRAPYWMQKMSLEWLYRLLQDPKRLFKRYFITNLKFIKLIMLDKS
ncbi:WecB/TagA/CpsF family glycosyltransferase [Romboutsia timonensis]|uniref:WecB/TagA/CpsF family glycosyltransferase n=1 Tax=Romboutsia timonensis TaxID=1776391 RepID=UPI002A80F291|nr:WecB/TagA/CpsF family glycosyltransferase [Romboutsia timonensis]MDY3959065.1 WecB/TagA/CpsF family glycosyltransferase [Romboutsia timonensis]